jgi:hypothetical protein
MGNLGAQEVLLILIIIVAFPVFFYWLGRRSGYKLQNPTKLTQLIRSKLTHHFAGVKLHKASISLVSIAA